MSYDVEIKHTAKIRTNPVVFKDTEIRAGQYGYYRMVNKEWVFISCGGAVYLKKIITNIDNQQEILRLYMDKANGDRIYINYPRADLNEQKVLGLTAWGCQIKRPNANIFIKSIENQEQTAQRGLLHEQLGFDYWKGKNIFKGATGIGVESDFHGKLRVASKGSYEEWKKMIEQEVIGQIPLEFILGVAVSGMLADYLKDSISMENIIVHCIGESSTGKTTGALLGVSIGSAPDMLGDNFVFSFLDTVNSLMRSIPNSYPTLIDEGSLLSEKDMTQMLYSLSGGVEKRRLTKNLENNESSRFRTALILTSEKSILAQCNNNSGLLVRNFEFENVTWTRSAESSDRIKEAIRKNYGHVVPMIAEAILKIEKEELVDRVSEEVQTIVKRAREAGTYNNLTERTAKQSAVILVSVDIIKEVLGLEFHKEQIMNFMEEHSLINDNERVSIGKRAMDWLLQSISRNRAGFITEETTETVNRCRGRLQKTKEVLLATGESSTLRLYITESEFTKILKEGKFSEKITVLKEWKKMDYLKSQSDRYLSKIKVIKEIEAKGYIIQLPSVAQKEDLREGKKSYFRSGNVVVNDESLLECDDEIKRVFGDVDIDDELGITEEEENGND